MPRPGNVVDYVLARAGADGSVSVRTVSAAPAPAPAPWLRSHARMPSRPPSPRPPPVAAQLWTALIEGLEGVWPEDTHTHLRRGDVSGA